MTIQNAENFLGQKSLKSTLSLTNTVVIACKRVLLFKWFALKSCPFTRTAQTSNSQFPPSFFLWFILEEETVSRSLPSPIPPPAPSLLVVAGGTARRGRDTHHSYVRIHPVITRCHIPGPGIDPFLPQSNCNMWLLFLSTHSTSCLFRLVYLNRCNTPHNVNDITTSHDHTRFPAATLSLPAGPYLHYPLGPEKRASMHSPRTALLSSSTAPSLHIIHTYYYTQTPQLVIILSFFRVLYCGL